MKLKFIGLRTMNLMVIMLLIACVSILNVHIPGSFAAENTANKKNAESANGQTPQDVAAEYQAAAITEKGKSPVPETRKESGGSNTLLYVGAGVAAAAAVAVAVGSGGGSGSSEPEPEPEPEPTKSPVGADLQGDNWHGRLIIKDSGFKEDVTATVKQNGSALEITTSSTQTYGKKFVGTINKSAFIKVRDQDTGQDWTTFYQNARWNMIDIYDFVHNFKDLDRLYLTRDAKQ